ncbi:hypothetical protein ACFRFH_13070 [Leifsonia sp. NPDC056824]|uniref:hypothetical protein n=1 Tax=Leifsonia sp. NPDC056824 TaxID=3345953 RepID=UPI003689D76E
MYGNGNPFGPFGGGGALLGGGALAATGFDSVTPMVIAAVAVVAGLFLLRSQWVRRARNVPPTA